MNWTLRYLWPTRRLSVRAPSPRRGSASARRRWRVPANSVTVFDRGFMSAQLLCNLVSHGENQHYTIPAKSNLRYEVVSGGDGDQIVRMRVSPQSRTKCPDLPESWQARTVRRGCKWAATHAADVPD
jgi:hypothetical protein